MGGSNNYREALEAVPGCEVLDFQGYGSYGGKWAAQVRYQGQEGFVVSSFGSCSSCDSFDGNVRRAEGCEEHLYMEEEGCPDCAQERVLYRERLRVYGVGLLAGKVWTAEQVRAEYDPDPEYGGVEEEICRWVEERKGRS